MEQPKAVHYYDELSEWEQTCSLYNHEFNELDTKLSVLIRQNHAPHFVENAKYFMEELEALKHDLRTSTFDMYYQEDHLKKDRAFVMDSEIPNSIDYKQQEFREKMKVVEKKFIDLKYSCYNFIARSA